MNTKLITLGLVLFIGWQVTAQKKEIKNAEKAVKESNYVEALTELKNAEELGILNENDAWKMRYYLTQGNAYLGKADGDEKALDILKQSAKAFQDALAVEADNQEAKEGIQNVRNSLLNMAIDDQKNDNFSASKDKLYTSYQLNKKDTLHLYYAAGSAINAEEYRDAIKYYKELLSIGYDGAKMQYFATSKETGEKELFNDKTYRDLVVKSGEYSNPEDVKSPSVKAEIAKNISTLYIQLEEPENAIESIGVAREINPEDITLIQAEADLYYQLGNIKKYQELMNLVKEKAPNDPIVYFNLGVSAEQLEDKKSAEEFYKKAIELDPEYVNAYLNVSSVILSKEKSIVDQMNELGMSAADNKKYEALLEERKLIYKDVLPYLEKAFKVDNENIGVIQTLMNIHYQLGNDEEAKKMKTRLDELKG